MCLLAAHIKSLQSTVAQATAVCLPKCDSMVHMTLVYYNQYSSLLQ